MRLKSVLKYGLTAALSIVSSSLGLAQAPVELKVGDMAPAFSAPGSLGTRYWSISPAASPWACWSNCWR